MRWMMALCTCRAPCFGLVEALRRERADAIFVHVDQALNAVLSAHSAAFLPRRIDPAARAIIGPLVIGEGAAGPALRQRLAAASCESPSRSIKL